jgi:hypothetical protein
MRGGIRLGVVLSLSIGGFGLSGCGTSTVTRFVAPKAASPTAIARFVTLTDRAMSGRFTARYRIALFKFRGRVFRGQVSVTQIPGTGSAFRETPGFLAFDHTHAYELLTGGRYPVSCDQSRRGARWSCISEIGEGMGGMAQQNDQRVPQAFTGGMEEAVSDYGSPALLIPAQAARYTDPVPMFLSNGNENGRLVQCLSVGNAAGAAGRFCTTPNGFIVSYRLAKRQSDNGYESAQLISFTSKTNRQALIPPAKPSAPEKREPRVGP